ncbi:AroB 3-dehydroquinate synthetase [Pyrenophora tritici-repentis]|uniref:2-epi-5-epi-valiolone synthase n=2 Tax=Pyrenophora tritici-repentis TaxID=45151 RepID=A0A2W1F9L9_9PLEO|nr:2-epi-5-epi-valiolone synthase [Pyrenophora tritici-repentis Pt-1C-BFP]KAA8623141.1 2-epi-5-epi-valiolone synthase [Pyrenophora tritici-repentis]EDU45310.1 2-epi-5-epi-valiolone synthase [Pyrenophora tritici-repentis Pt-1C-BFP]KAF7452136.1 2-epi-5-epi-valiolone synthase [Pyrenophora tritici-repentis]KAF7574747.1 AroB, 3-dehydroquinate synthetase [Pyrenophora tritici-repentis]KAI0588087.1 2-epi-5-epi-valiolone synthase [Pyrenophora tritici-repentis]
MSDLKASVVETKNGFHVEGYEKIEYDFTFLDGVFNPANNNLAQCYERWGRCLAVMDLNIYNVYGDEMQKYFDHYNLPLTIHKTMIGEKAKSMETLLSIVDSMTEFGIIRKEPVLVVGGGLVTDVAGFACAAYRRNTNFIRIPTTVIGLIDASVSIKVAVNYGNYKNRLGAYHAPMHTFLDFSFLKTLPEGQVRNGFAELIKISTCAHKPTFDLLDKYCEKLITSRFGREGDDKEVLQAADEINRAGIHEMLKLETPNLHEIGLDRVIAYGHTWSPLHELSPKVPLRHGHAISIDMAYSATLANQRGLLSDEEHRRLLNLFSRAGLSMDHELFDEDMLDKATKAILKTRDGLLRAAVPNPIGTCVFLNDVTAEEMNKALRRHKELMKEYPRDGAGLDAFVDASDTGYTMNDKPVEDAMRDSKKVMNGMSNGAVNDTANGHANGFPKGLQEVMVNGYENGYKN